MIIKTWKFKGFASEMPDWVKENAGKRLGSSDLFVYTQEGELPCETGQYIAINLRGHVSVHTKLPKSVYLLLGGKEALTAIAFMALVVSVLVIILAM